MKPVSLARGALLASTLAIAAHSPFALAQAAGAAASHPFGQSQPIPGRFIVVFKSSVADAAAEAASLVRGNGGRLLHTYSGALKGFAASLPEAALQGIRNNPNVEFVEQDQTVSLQQIASPQNQVTWGLDRIDQADRPLDTQNHFTQSGASVNAFVIDTGIRADHVEFAGRVRPGFSAIADGNGTNDCNGHGTHVAGTLGGSTWGVAKGVALTPVRVLDCSGSGAWSGVIAGIDYVANSTLRPAVANMSLGGAASSAVDSAVAGAVAKGVSMVVAAGNNGADACAYSPARAPSAITVGATTSIDYRASYSNYGSCVDIFAPGHNITSAWNTSPTASNTIGGTSMASPHVAGVAVLALAANPRATPADVAAFITSTATPNRLSAATPNLLLYSMGTGGNLSPPAQTAQTVAFRSMTASATRQGGNWRASVTVGVRDVSSGAAVANATVSGSFSPGGKGSCVTGSSGTCTITSSAIKNNAGSSSTFTGTGISGTLMVYDAAQNSASQVVISRP
jgi:subtilisin family serine protease